MQHRAFIGQYTIGYAYADMLRSRYAAFLTNCYDARLFGQRAVELDFLSSSDCDTDDSS